MDLDQVLFDESYFVKATRFDWFCASVEVDIVLFVQAAKLHFDADVEHIQPRSGYQYAVKIFKGSRNHCIVMWGGSNVGSALYVLATGYEADALRDWLVISYPSSRLIRADVCIDIDAPYVFDSLYRLCLAVARKRKLKTSNSGDWSNKIQGRTFYVGSRQSPSFLRLYEKGKQLINGSEHHARLEVEFKPKNSVAREHWFSQPASSFWSFNKWVSELFSSLSGLDVPVSAIKVGTVYRESSHDRAMHHLIKQYRSTIQKELTFLGGDYKVLLSRLIGDDFYDDAYWASLDDS